MNDETAYLKEFFIGIETSLPDLLAVHDFFTELAQDGNDDDSDIIELAEWYMREVDNTAVCALWAIRAISKVCEHIHFEQTHVKHEAKPTQLSLW